MTALGVFKETTVVRDAGRVFGPDGVTPDAAQQRVIREAMKQFLEPYSGHRTAHFARFLKPCAIICMDRLARRVDLFSVSIFGALG